MRSSPCLINPAASVVIDTSVAINLCGCGVAREILQALPYQLLAVDTVPAELEEGRKRGRQDAERLAELVEASHIGIVTLEESALAIFETLVLGSAAMTLDDGEAATIAYAFEHGAIAVIDDRKAIRVCGEKFPALRLGCTVDLFAHPDVEKTLGRPELAQAVLNALQLARMRVPTHHVDWVVGLIGEERATLCTSLPRGARSASMGYLKQVS